MPSTFPESSVNTNYFTDNQASGGKEGTPFKFIKLDEGAILTKIQAWKEGGCIRGVEVWMSDDSTYLSGCRAGDLGEFQFQSGERITGLYVQANGGKRKRLGAIWFKTSKGKEWGIHSSGLHDDAKYFPKVGSGVCCGVFGSAGLDVDRFGFAMLREVDRAVLTEVKYPTLDMQAVPNKPDVVAKQTFSNGSDIEQTFELSGSKSVTVTREWSLSTALSKTFSIEATAKIPFVDVTTKLSWTVGITTTQALSKTETSTRSWKWPLKCPPHTSILGEATMYADVIDTDYEGVVELRLKNGKVYKHKVKGVYNGINIRDGTVTVKTVDPVH